MPYQYQIHATSLFLWSELTLPPLSQRHLWKAPFRVWLTPHFRRDPCSCSQQCALAAAAPSPHFATFRLVNTSSVCFSLDRCLALRPFLRSTVPASSSSLLSLELTRFLSPPFCRSFVRLPLSPRHPRPARSDRRSPLDASRARSPI